MDYGGPRKLFVDLVFVSQPTPSRRRQKCSCPLAGNSARLHCQIQRRCCIALRHQIRPASFNTFALT